MVGAFSANRDHGEKHLAWRWCHGLDNMRQSSKGSCVGSLVLIEAVLGGDMGALKGGA